MIGHDSYGQEVHMFLCHCSHPEHTLRVDYVPQWNEVTFEVFLAPAPWYKRIWQAVKHVFGYKSKYGHFTSIAFDPSDATEMVNLMKRVKERQEQIDKEDEDAESPTVPTESQPSTAIRDLRDRYTEAWWV